MKKILLLLCALILAWYLLPRQELISETKTELDDYIPALMLESAIPGMAIAKISDGETAYMKTFGYANIETGKAVDENTLFNIASISKPIMGLALLQLVEQNKLSLDADVNEYLPFTLDNPHLQGEKITLRHLASHSSGIADYYDTNSYAINQDAPLSLEQHIKSLLTAEGQHYNQGEHFLKQWPGQGRKYSNLAAGLAGYLVQASTGQSLADYSKKQLFPSLGMQDASWLLHDLSLEEIAVPYEVEQCTPVLKICADTESPRLNHIISEYFNPPAEYKNYQAYPHFGNPQYPDGGVRASIKELSRFLVAVLNNQDASGRPLLSGELYEEMFALQLTAKVSDSQRFFWRDNSMKLTGHMGSDLGVFTAMYFDINSKDGFIILMNRGMDGKAAAAMKKIATKLMQDV